MVVEFTCSRDAVRNYIDIALASSDRALYIDASVVPHVNTIPLIRINYTRGSAVDNYLGLVSVNYTVTTVGTSNRGAVFGAISDFQESGGNTYMYGLFVGNSATYNVTGGTATIYGVWVNFAERTLPTVGTKPPTLTGIRIDYTIPADSTSYAGGIIGGTVNVITNKDTSNAQPRGWTAYYKFATGTIQTFGSNEYFIYQSYLQIDAGATINYGGSSQGPGLRHYLVNMNLNATGTITNNVSCYIFASAAMCKGIFSGNFDVFSSVIESASTFTAVSLRHSRVDWNISGTTISGYAAAYDADINVNTRIFSVYGARIDIDGTMAGTATWRGYYLNAAGVTCGATRFFYGLDIDFTGMGIGGTIAGINVNTPTNIPAIMFPLVTGNTVVTTGDVAGVARSMTFNMPVIAGGAAAAGLSWLFQLDSVTEAGLIAETDGAGTYRLPLFKVPNYSADYGIAWAAPPAPGPAGLVNGCMFIAHNTNGNLYRMYCYTNAGWHYVTLT